MRREVCQGRSGQQHKRAGNEWERGRESGLGTRLNPARNNGKRCPACTRLMLCTGLPCSWAGVRVARARAELMCLMLMLSAREGSRQFKGISGSARRLMESCQSRARARALAVISARDVVMVMAAPTPPQRAPHLALLVTAVARTSRVNGADRLRGFKAADQRSKPRGKGCRSVPEGSFTRNHRKSWESSADST